MISTCEFNMSLDDASFRATQEIYKKAKCPTNERASLKMTDLRKVSGTQWGYDKSRNIRI